MIGREDNLLAQRDAHLAGLRLILDDSEMADLVRQHFSGCHIIELQREYVRYKPHTSCLVKFLAKTDLGDQTFHAVTYRKDANVKLTKATELSERLSFNSDPIVVPRHHLAVYPFPVDRRIPSLAHLSTADGLRHLLNKMSRSLSSDEVTLHPLRYKPQRRFVGRIDVGGQPRLVIRLYNDREFTIAKRAAKTFNRSHVKTTVCLGHSDRHRAILFEWQAGDSLHSCIRHRQAQPATLTSVGRELARLHKLALRKLPIRTPADHAGHLQESVDILAWLLPDMTDRIHSLSAHIATLFDRLPGVSPSPIHGDFGPTQVVIQNDKTTLIDLDNAALGMPASDLGMFLAHLERSVCLGSQTRVGCDEVFEAVLDGYLSGGPPVDRTLVKTMASAILLSMAQEPFRQGQTGWLAAGRRIVEGVEELLREESRASTPSGERRHAHAVSRNGIRTVRDSGIPFLASATSPGRASQALLPLVSPEDPLRVRLSQITVVRVKPHRRCLVQYDFARRGSERDIQVLGKIHVRPRHESALRRQEALWNAGFSYSAADGICVPRAVGIVDRWNMWLQEVVLGKTAWGELCSAHPEPIARRIADAAYKLHQAGIPATRHHSTSDELAVLKGGLQQLAHQMPRLADRLESLYLRCANLAAGIPIVQPAGIHRDFHPDQILVDGNRLFVVDHDLYCIGDPCLDVGNFCGHLIEWSVRKRRDASALDNARLTIVDHFASLNSASHPRTIEIYTLLTLARHVYLSQRYLDRKSTMLDILDHCERAMASRVVT